MIKPARFLALLLGCSLAGVILGVGLWIRFRPGPTQEIEFHVVDQRGIPIERFGWSLWDETPGAVLNPGVREEAHPAGIATARVPVHRLAIEIEAKGLHRTKVGPFEVAALPARLDVVVPDLGVVAGTVTYGGRPVAGAKVMLTGSKPDVIDGIPSGLVSGYQDFAATTDGSGAFRIGSDFPDMEYYVRASHDGYAAGTSGPAHVGDAPLEVQLHDGGSIEGRLRLPEGRDPNGVEFELYRMDAADWEVDAYGHCVVRADKEGRFRYEHVDPGSWLVRLRDPTATRYGERQCPLDQVPVVVEVAEHDSARLEMDLSQPVARLEGHALLNGKPWSHAWACLYTMSEQALTLDWAPADKDGRWTLRARARGTYRLVVCGNHQHAIEPRYVSDLVELAQDGARWEREFTWDRSDPPEIVLDRKH